MDIENFIRQYWDNVTMQKEEELKKYFFQDACIRWHNTNEQFTVTEFMRANCDYPGSWKGEVERIEHAGNTIITATHVWNEDMSFHVTSFFKIKDDKIKALDEYWGDDGEVPQWRQHEHIGSKIC